MLIYIQVVVYCVTDLRQELAVVKRSESQPMLQGGGGAGDLPSPPSMPVLQLSKDAAEPMVPPAIPEVPLDSNRLSEEREGLHMVAQPAVGSSPTTPLPTKTACKSLYSSIR